MFMCYNYSISDLKSKESTKKKMKTFFLLLEGQKQKKEGLEKFETSPWGIKLRSVDSTVSQMSYLTIALPRYHN